jgi:hypothetical protein
MQESLDTMPLTCERPLTWREKNNADKAEKKAQKLLDRMKQYVYKNATISQRMTYDPRPGSTQTVAGREYIVQKNGEYRRKR